METKETVHRILVISGIVADGAEKWKFFILNCYVIHITSLLKELFVLFCCFLILLGCVLYYFRNRYSQ